MPFLTIGAATVDVLATNADEVAPTRVGRLVRAFDGSLRSTQRVRKREWHFSTPPIAQAAYDSLVAAVDTGSPVSCSGDGLSGAAVTCFVHVEGASYIQNDASHLRSARLVLREV